MSFSAIPCLTKPKPGVMLNPLHHLSQGLVGYWLFNEGTGSRANDISGHGNHGTLKNMSPNAQGSGWGGSKFGGGLKFDGVNDYVDCGNDSSLAIEDAITVEGWIYPIGDGSYHTIVGRASHADSYWLALRKTGYKLVFYMEGTTASAYQTTATNIWSIDSWNHVVVTYNSSAGSNNLNFYVNGNLVDDSTQTGTIGLPGTSLRIGKSWTTYLTNGSIAFVRIWKRAVLPMEVKQLYHDPFVNLLRVPVRYVPAAPPVGAIMNQFQNFNIGADLYNGAIIA